MPITDDSIILQNFFEKMEFLLLFGMKPKNNGLFRRKEHQTEFFSFFRAVCRSSKSLIDGLRYVNDQDQLKTNIGKGRALLRYSLTRQSLGDLIQSCCTAKDIQKQFYSPSGLLIHPAMQHVTGTKQKNDFHLEFRRFKYNISDNEMSHEIRISIALYLFICNELDSCSNEIDLGV